MGEHGYSLGNIDCTIVAQRPKLSPHKETIRAALCSLLGAHPSVVNIKVGRGLVSSQSDISFVVERGHQGHVHRGARGGGSWRSAGESSRAQMRDGLQTVAFHPITPSPQSSPLHRPKRTRRWIVWARTGASPAMLWSCCTDETMSSRRLPECFLLDCPQRVCQSVHERAACRWSGKGVQEQVQIWSWGSLAQGGDNGSALRPESGCGMKVTVLSAQSAMRGVLHMGHTGFRFPSAEDRNHRSTHSKWNWEGGLRGAGVRGWKG